VIDDSELQSFEDKGFVDFMDFIEKEIVKEQYYKLKSQLKVYLKMIESSKYDLII